jgi:hypothetical protein
MPIVVGKQIKKLHIYKNFNEYVGDDRFLIDIGEIAKKYRHMLLYGTNIRIYLSGIFNEEFKLVSEPRIFSLVTFINATSYNQELRHGYQQADGYYIDVDDLANQLCLPDGYSMEILMLSLSNQKFGEKVLFPYETKTDASQEIEAKSLERIEALRKIGIVSQSHSFFAELGLKDIAEELSKGYDRFEKGDYDGAIKAYRKVVEGFRNYLGQKEGVEGKKVFKKLIDNSENRTEKIIDFLNKTYGLLSNFGEHYGTHAFEEEGIFANSLIEDLAEYLTKKLKK